MAKEIYFSTDVLADILRRLPPVSRRRARLVCRHWRDVINKYTTEMQSRPTTLIWNVNFAVAYVLGADLSSSSSSSMGSCLELWKRPTTSIYPKRKDVYLVGSCNGLICMCDNEERTGGAVTVVNPATGETSAVPPLPFSRLFIGSHGRKLWHKAYNFAYHPTTGKYKVVHVPYSCERVFEFQTVQVFTLGETKWRQVPAPADARCDLAAGVLTIDGMTHWVRAGGAPRIMSFDLDAEHVASTRMGLPKLTDGRESYQLTEVHGRLGLVATSRDVWDTSSDVWVLEKGQRWSHRYNLEHFVPMPHFVYREHVLTWRRSSFYTHQRKSTPPSSGWRLRSESDNVVCINNQDEGTLVADMTQCPGNLQTFAYVETMEPLSVYVKNWN